MSKTLFSDGNPLQGILGTIVNSTFLNKIFSHRHDGLDQDGSAPLEYAVATGAVNAYAVTLTPALTAHITGMPIRFKANLANTAACTLNVNGLGAVSITGANGAALTSGSIKLNQIVTVVYNGTSYELACQTWDAKLTALANLITAADKMIYATGSDTFSTATLTAFARTLLDDTTGGAVFSTMGATQSLASNGYQKLPSGLIIQWGLHPSSSASGTSVVFPVTFPVGPTGIFGAVRQSNPSFTFVMTPTAQTPSGFVLNKNFVGSSMFGNAGEDVYWFAIGY